VRIAGGSGGAGEGIEPGLGEGFGRGVGSVRGGRVEAERDIARDNDTETLEGGARARGARRAALPFGRGLRVSELDLSKKDLPEPSGVAYHEERGTLFVVGDRGHIAEVSLQGDVIDRRKLGDYDLEGVTIGPSGRVFAVSEAKPPQILEIKPGKLEIRRRFELEKKVDGERIVARHANDGLEGLTYIPSKGCFYALNQDRPPALLKLRLPLEDEDGGKAKIDEVIDLKAIIRDGASDVTFDPRSGNLLVLEAGSKKGRGVLHELTLEGELVRSVPVPGDLPEGFCLGPNGSAFLTQDSGGMLRVDPGY
jgi:uncharacterized protein YjiK